MVPVASNNRGVRSEQAFDEHDAVAVLQHDVVLPSVDDLPEIVAERLLGTGHNALEDDSFRGAVSRTSRGGERLQKGRRLRAAELHASRMHDFAENVNVDGA